MTTEQIIATLREHNEWRRGGEGEMIDPKTIGEAIEAACDMMETMQRERDEAIAARKASAADWLNQICQANARVSRAFRERDEALAAIVGWEIKWKCAVEMAAQAEVERDEALEELENHKASSIHTCHDNCKRPMCVLRRERDELLDRLTAIELRMPEELARLERERDAERALADRLAGALKNPSVLVAVEALIAWKEARRE